jgi:DNA polymerase-3 subunit chi
MTTGESFEDLADFERCLDIFDGNQEEATEKAYARLASYRRQGYTPQFWEQTQEGRWQEKSL